MVVGDRIPQRDRISCCNHQQEYILVGRDCSNICSNISRPKLDQNKQHKHWFRKNASCIDISDQVLDICYIVRALYSFLA